MAFTLLKPTGIDLSQTFAFTGTVSGAGGGKLLQTVQHTFTTEQSYNNTTMATSFITGAITPTSSSSKILVEIKTISSNNDTSNSYSQLQIFRGGSGIGNKIHIDRMYGGDHGAYRYLPVSINYLDSPNTTSATTYALYRYKQGGGSAYLGINGTQSTLTLMEIGA